MKYNYIIFMIYFFSSKFVILLKVISVGSENEMDALMLTATL
jgi:hypothetical protein